MARLCIAAAIVSVARCLQIGAGIDKVVTLPEVKQVLEKPQAMYSDIRSHVGSFEDQLLEVQKHNEETVSKLKARLETNLTAQKSDNRAMETFNTNLTHEISSLNKDINKLREKATKFEKTNAKLDRDLKVMKGNMTTATEFLAHALNASDEMLDSAPELEVLEHLNRLDDEQAVQKIRLQRLQQVHVSLLAVGGAPPKTHKKSQEKDVDAHELLELMSTALAELAEEENASELALMTEFEREYAVGTYHTVELKAKQQELSTTKAAAIQLKERLVDALQHLSDTHDMLLDRAQSIRLFSRNMAGKPLPGSGKLSLLQTGAKLPPKSVLKKPSSTYTSMNTGVSALAAQLEQVNEKGEDEVEDQKKEYEAQLLEIKHNITRQDRENREVVRDIKKLDVSIAGWSAKAEQFTKTNSIIRTELKSMQASIDLVQEFATSSLEKSDENTSQTPELLILSELELEDNTKKQEMAHKKSLEFISKKQADAKKSKSTTLKAARSSKAKLLSLLQVSKKERPTKHEEAKHADAHELLATLAANLEQLMADQAEGQAALQASFEEERANLTTNSAALVEEWSTLNATRASRVVVESRLKVAVSHLTKTGKSLEKRRESLLSFGRKLAARPDPLSNVKQPQQKGNKTDLSLVQTAEKGSAFSLAFSSLLR